MKVVVLCLVSAACATPAVVPAEATTSTTPPHEAVSIEIEAPPEPEVYAGFTASAIPEGMTLVAIASAETQIYTSTDAGTPDMSFPEATILGTPTVFRVLDGPTKGRVLVSLPMRPNGSTGWIDEETVELFVVSGRVEIDLSEKRLTYFEDGESVLETSVAIGTDRNPTPTGSFFVTDNVTLANPNSPWGPHALGLSARSDTITEYNGGDGIIGIHGTNKPGSIGKAASLGCVRLPNDLITQLHEMIPIGTPVEIVA